MININTTMVLGFVLGIAFTLLLLDNLFLRRKIFKMYERLIFTNKNNTYTKRGGLSDSDIDRIIKETK